MRQILQKNTDRLMMKWKGVLLALIVLFTFTGANAQFYPVQTTTQLIPPYSVYLSDYATGGNEKLRVILLQRDLTQPSYQLRLVMTVELNGQVIMRTSRSYNPAPINLNPGIPTVISGAELAPYVDSRNIDFVGYSRDQYERTKALPEGSYQITFTAYDYRRQDVQVSNSGISFYYLSKNEPPLINFPACGTKVPMRTPQQIVFSWLSRNTASPNSAADTEFELSLYETRPEGRNPNDVVLSTQPVFRIMVDLPQYIYSPSDPLLLNGMKYVWRVRAIDRNGKDAFRNNGYSEVCTFTYGGSDPDFDMGVVKNLQAEGETERKGRIWWDLGDYDGYVANYRKTGEGYEWFTSTITKEELVQAGKTQGEVKLFDLEPDTEYETRVQPKKSGFLGAYTDIIKFRTKPHVIAQCGVNPNLPQADLTRPLRSGIKGMLIQVDDIEIQLMDVLHLGDGWYKGTGRTSIPYFGGAVFAVTFDRLYIDESRVAGLGRIDFVTQGVAGLVEQQNANLVITKKDLLQKENREKWKEVIFFENIFVYDDIVISNVTADASGTISIIDNSGNATPNDAIKNILNTTPEKAIIIQDKNGDQYVVQKDGANTKVTKVEGGGLAPGADGKMLDEQAIKNLYKMILISLNKYKTAIDQYLVATNPPKGKGGGDRIINWNLIRYLADLPACLEEHKDQLSQISTKIVALADSAHVESREFATRITPLITIVTQEKVDEVVCAALPEDSASGSEEEDQFVITVNNKEYPLLNLKEFKDGTFNGGGKTIYYGYDPQSPLNLSLSAAIHKKNGKIQKQNVDWFKGTGEGKESLAKNKSDAAMAISTEDQAITVIFTIDYPAGSTTSLTFPVNFIGAKPDVYFNLSNVDEEKEMRKGLGGKISVFGSNEIDLMTAFKNYKNYIKGKDNDAASEYTLNIELEEDDKIVKEIKWNGAVVSVSDFYGWNSYSVDIAKQNTLEVVPYLGVSTTFTISPKAAPPVIIDRGRFTNVSNYGIDDYESYRSLDRKDVSAFYNDVVMEVNGIKYYAPILKFNVETTDIDLNLIPLNFPQLEGPCRYVVETPDGLKSTINIQESITKLLGRWKLKKPTQEGEVIIRDLLGNVKGKIKLEAKKATPDERLTLNLVKLIYKGRSSSQIVPAEIRTELAQAYNQINIQWTVNDNIKNVELKDSDIPEVGLGGVSKARAIQLLTSSSLSTQEERIDYEKVLANYYGLVLAKNPALPKTSNNYYMLALHNDVSQVLYGFAVTQTSAFFISTSIPNRTVPHEVGHNLGLGEICVDLNRCEAKNKDCISVDELQRNSTNIMGYSDGYNFSRWQLPIIKNRPNK